MPREERQGLRLGFGGKRPKAEQKPRGRWACKPTDSLVDRCAKSLGEELTRQAEDVGEWGPVVASWPAAALERVLPLLPARTLMRLEAAFEASAPAVQDASRRAKTGRSPPVPLDVDRPPTGRGPAAAAAWIFCGGATTRETGEAGASRA